MLPCSEAGNAGEAAEVDDHIIDHGEQHARVVPLRLVGLKRRQNVRFSISETRDRAAAVRLEYRNGTMLKNMETTRGRVIYWVILPLGEA